MDNLQWFKFSPSDWMMGRIQRQSPQVQVDFLRLCCKYWQKDGDFSIEDAKIEAIDSYDVLIKYKIIKECDSCIVIDFLDEQFDSIESKREQASKAGLASVEARRKKKEVNDRSTTVQQNLTTVEICSTEFNREEKRREEKNREEKKTVIPPYEDFRDYALDKCSELNFNVSETQINAKYQSWVENNWRNGNGKPIKNWKTNILNTLPFMNQKGAVHKPETDEERDARIFMETVKDYNTHKTLYGEESANLKFYQNVQSNIDNNRLT